MKVLITGGSRGIGKIISKKFESENYEVFKPTRNELDLLDNDSIDNFINKYKNIVFDVIINNAGINPLNFLKDIRELDLDETIQINLKAPFKIIKGFAENMKAQSYGRIVNISSIWSIVSKEKRIVYSISKTGLNGLTKSSAVELAKYNILVNSVCPGYVNTELTFKNNTSKDIEKVIKNIPLCRLAEPEEISELVFFLSSNKNSYVTGQIIAIDGGYTSV